MVYDDAAAVVENVEIMVMMLKHVGCFRMMTMVVMSNAFVPWDS